MSRFLDTALIKSSAIFLDEQDLKSNIKFKFRLKYRQTVFFSPLQGR